MTIQSEEFLNTKRFPSIKGKGGEEKIKINPKTEKFVTEVLTRSC